MPNVSSSDLGYLTRELGRASMSRRDLHIGHVSYCTNKNTRLWSSKMSAMPTGFAHCTWKRTALSRACAVYSGECHSGALQGTMDMIHFPLVPEHGLSKLRSSSASNLRPCPCLEPCCRQLRRCQLRLREELDLTTFLGNTNQDDQNMKKTSGTVRS